MVTDILDLIDNATEQRCACGCRAALDPDGPSAWFASQECQRRWGDARATDPQDVYDRPDAEHELTGRRACGHLLCAGLPYCRESPGLIRLREVADRLLVPKDIRQALAMHVPDPPSGPDLIGNIVAMYRRVTAANSADPTPTRWGYGPDWLLDEFPDRVGGWESRGEMWRTQTGDLFVRDAWLYTLRVGDHHASVIVPAEQAGLLEGRGAIERELRQMIQAQREGPGS